MRMIPFVFRFGDHVMHGTSFEMAIIVVNRLSISVVSVPAA